MSREVYTIVLKDLNLYLNSHLVEDAADMANGMYSSKPTDYLVGLPDEIRALLDFLNKDEPK